MSLKDLDWVKCPLHKISYVRPAGCSWCAIPGAKEAAEKWIAEQDAARDAATKAAQARAKEAFEAETNRLQPEVTTPVTIVLRAKQHPVVQKLLRVRHYVPRVCQTKPEKATVLTAVARTKNIDVVWSKPTVLAEPWRLVDEPAPTVKEGDTVRLSLNAQAMIPASAGPFCTRAKGQPCVVRTTRRVEGRWCVVLDGPLGRYPIPVAEVARA